MGKEHFQQQQKVASWSEFWMVAFLNESFSFQILFGTDKQLTQMCQYNIHVVTLQFRVLPFTSQCHTDSPSNSSREEFRL